MIAIPLFTSYKNLVDADIQQHINNLIVKNYYEDTSLYNYKVYRKKNSDNLINYKKIRYSN